jgi:probable phosphoglycerate mutase
MPISYLIRHGSNPTIGRLVAGWTPGVHLDELGIVQAQCVAESLAESGIAAVYSSPLERAVETAAPIAARLGVQLSIHESLGEIRYGEWTGRTLFELDRDPRWAFYQSHRGVARIPGGESMLEVQARMVGEIESLARRHADRSFAVVSHGDVIRLAIVHALGCGIDSIRRFDVDPASVSKLDLSGDGPRLVALNDRAHLHARVPALFPERA